MAVDAENLVWIDLEMTGLDPDRDHVIEIATIVTDKHLSILAEGPVLAIKQSQALLIVMVALFVISISSSCRIFVALCISNVLESCQSRPPFPLMHSVAYIMLPHVS